MAYTRVKYLIEQTVALGLIYLNSHARDFKNPEIRPYLDQFCGAAADCGGCGRRGSQRDPLAFAQAGSGHVDRPPEPADEHDRAAVPGQRRGAQGAHATQPRSTPRVEVEDLVGHAGGCGLRLTYRTLAVLQVIAAEPGLSNKQIGERAGIVDQGQISRLLARLCERGLTKNTGGGQPIGAANAWWLTPQGEQLALASEREALGAAH